MDLAGYLDVIVAQSHCLPGVEAAVCLHSLQGRKLITPPAEHNKGKGLLEHI